VFERERRVARSFQDAALPARLPEVPGFDFHAIYEAGKAEALVGGDWYDAFTLENGQIVVSIGDVAGSGLSAAVTMASVRQAIRGAAHAAADPSGMLDAADRALDDPERRFVTAFVGVIDPLASNIAYQNAGHPPPVLRMPDGTLRALRGGGPPLGVRKNGKPGAYEHPLPAGSLLALYTDGLIESTRDILEGERRLHAALLDPALADVDNPAKMLHDLVLVDGSRDDVAILTIATR
jgi:serine phosphatase RsbU (regulator of sigma subunit)